MNKKCKQTFECLLEDMRGQCHLCKHYYGPDGEGGGCNNQNCTEETNYSPWEMNIKIIQNNLGLKEEEYQC